MTPRSPKCAQEQCREIPASRIVDDEHTAPFRPSFTRVPNDHLAQVLDRGSSSVPAVRLLIEKHRHGPGYVLNQKNCAKKRADGGLGMSKRAFTVGIRVMKCGPLVRWQTGRRLGGGGAFAREAMRPGSQGFVHIDEAMLRKESFKLVAFVAATLLSPIPRPAAYFARRIGLRGKVSVGKLVERAYAGNYISAVKRGSAWIVARPGVDLTGFEATSPECNNGAVKKGSVESGGGQSGATHSEPEDFHREQKEAHTPTESPAQPAESRDFQEARLQELRDRDLAGALARHLLTPAGLRGYCDLLQKYGDVAHAAILRKLTELAMALDGTDPGKVTSWNYFHGAIADERKRFWLEMHGLRPGDTLGLHRDVPAPPSGDES